MAALQFSTAPFSGALLHCTGCAAVVDPAKSLGFSCPNAASQPGVDHILAPATPFDAEFPTSSSSHPNPFVHYRSLMFVYKFALAHGLSDEAYVAIAEELDAGLAQVGVKFAETPLIHHEDLGLWVKDESNQVGQSHKVPVMFVLCLCCVCVCLVFVLCLSWCLSCVGFVVLVLCWFVWFGYFIRHHRPAT